MPNNYDNVHVEVQHLYNQNLEQPAAEEGLDEIGAEFEAPAEDAPENIGYIGGPGLDNPANAPMHQWNANPHNIAPVHALKAKKKPAYANKNKWVEEYGEKTRSDSGTIGLMVFYINVGNMANGQALDMIDKVKEQYKIIEKRLAMEGIEMMWLPTRTGDTQGQFFSFRN